MLNAFLNVSKAVAGEVQSALAEANPALARDLDLPQRQRFLELLARGFEPFVRGLARATRAAGEREGTPADSIQLGPRPASDSANTRGVPREADDEAFAEKFAQLFLDMGGIFPKLAQVLSLRPDLIKNETILRRLRAVQEECRQAPFAAAVELAMAESTAFREGELVLVEWPDYQHAGSIAQVAPFLTQDRAASIAAAETEVADGSQGDKERAQPRQSTVPDGVVKLTFAAARKQMEIDFRLLRSQLRLMEHSGQWTHVIQQGFGIARSGAGGDTARALSPENIRLVKEVWAVMVGLEDEVLREFDMRHEAACQEHGRAVLEALLDDDCASDPDGWLNAWRDAAFLTMLQPAGPRAAGQAQQCWRDAGAASSRGWGQSGWFTRMARWAVGGRELAAGCAEGEEHLSRLRAALKTLRIRVPAVFEAASGPHVLTMEVAVGRSLKEVLDVATLGNADGEASGPTEAAKMAAAWFSALLLFVIIPLWGKMLLEVGCCHADPHPGNFKVDGVPGLDEAVDSSNVGRRQPGSRIWSRLSRNNGPAPTACTRPITLTVLDWGSCVDLDDGARRELCRMVVGLSDLRRLAKHGDMMGSAGADSLDAEARTAEMEAIRQVAASVRAFGVTIGQDREDRDEFQAALGMALFDPRVLSKHPLLRGEQAQQELSQSIPAQSAVGKVLRVVAILVGMSCELERRINAEATDRVPQVQADQPLVALFLADLWRPFAKEGLQELGAQEEVCARGEDSIK